jgi:hypothetical protein
MPEEAEGPGIWVCGSYAYPGIPLLEGCVVSAKNVVEAIVTLELGEEVDDARRGTRARWTSNALKRNM